MFNVSKDFDEEKIRNLFKNSSRIIQIEFKDIQDPVDILSRWEGEEKEKPEIDTESRLCYLHFSSNSGARKTLETLIDQENYQFYWVNTSNKVVSKAIPYKKPAKRDSVTESENIPNISRRSTAEESKEEKNLDYADEEGCGSPNPRGSVSSNYSGGWRSFVFPILATENSGSDLSISSDNSYDDEENASEVPEHPLWKEVEQKEIDIMNKIKEDSNFVNKILTGFNME